MHVRSIRIALAGVAAAAVAATVAVAPWHHDATAAKQIDPHAPIHWSKPRLHQLLAATEQATQSTSRDELVAQGRVLFRRAHEGAPGFAHGGAVAAALDDAIGMLIFRMRRPAVTRRLEVDYVAPCFVGRRYDVTAVCERVEGRKLWMVASLREDDRVVA